MSDYSISPAVIARLTPKKQLAFALLVIERMLPQLEEFSIATGRDFTVCMEAKDSAWAALQKRESDSFYRLLKQACFNCAPDTEDFTHEMTSQALDAVVAIADTMEFLLDGKTEPIGHVAELAGDSVYGYVGIEEPHYRIAAHPLIRQELRRQGDDISYLAGLGDVFDEETVSALKKRASTRSDLLHLAD